MKFKKGDLIGNKQYNSIYYVVGITSKEYIYYRVDKFMNYSIKLPFDTVHRLAHLYTDFFRSVDEV